VTALQRSKGGVQLISSTSKVIKAQFRPEPSEVKSRHVVISPGGFGRVIFKHFEPINDLGTAFSGSDRGAR
jgi:hypothetical protein